MAGVSMIGAGSAMTCGEGGEGESEEGEGEAKASPRRSLAANADSASSGFFAGTASSTAFSPPASPSPTSSTSSARYSSIDVTFSRPPEFQ